MRTILSLFSLLVISNPIQAFEPIDVLRDVTRKYLTTDMNSENVDFSKILSEKFFSIDKFYDYASDYTGPVHLGVFEIEREDKTVVSFSLIYDEKANILSMAHIEEFGEDACPKEIRSMIQLSLFYSPVDLDEGKKVEIAKLFDLRNEVLKALSETLIEKGLGSPLRIEIPLRPVANIFEPQEFIIIYDFKTFYEAEIIRAVADLKVEGAARIFASRPKVGHVLDGASCKQL
jgi:hypothetical protein